MDLTERKSNIRTFLLSHRTIPSEFTIDESRHVLVQCGTSENGKIDGFDFYDDSESNPISDMNWCFSEATGISALANDTSVLRNCEYAEFCHYRRYLDFDVSRLKPNTILCSRYHEKIPLIRQFSICHPTDAISELIRHCSECGDFGKWISSSFGSYMMNSNVLYMSNCFACPSEMMEEYFEFVRRVIPLMADVVRCGRIPSGSYDRYQKRYMSFIFERITSFWIVSMNSRGCEVCDVPLVSLSVENNENSLGKPSLL